MQALLNELQLPTLQLLQKVTEKATKENDEKFRTLKRTNETCRAKIFDVPKVVHILELMGWTESPEGLVFPVNGSVKTLELGLHAIDKAICDQTNASQREYEERKAHADARAVLIQQNHILEQQKKELELKKIKSIQSDVRERPVLASHADATMGRSSAAIGIFSGAGGKSSSARTFSDIGINLNQ